MNYSQISECLLSGQLQQIASDADSMCYAASTSDDRYIATALENGNIHVLDGETLQTLFIQSSSLPHTDLPCTGVWCFPLQRDREASVHVDAVDNAAVVSTHQRSRSDNTVYCMVSASSTGAIIRWEWNGTNPGFETMVNKVNTEIM